MKSGENQKSFCFGATQSEITLSHSQGPFPLTWIGADRPGTSDPMTKLISTQNWKKERQIFQATSKSEQIMVNLVNLRTHLTILFKEKFKINTKRDFGYENFLRKKTKREISSTIVVTCLRYKAVRPVLFVKQFWMLPKWIKLSNSTLMHSQ